MKKFVLSICLLIALSVPFCTQAQQGTLRTQVEKIAKSAKGIVGVSILNIESRDTLNYNGNARLVMQSIMKFPVALTVLHWVDTGKLSLDKMIKIKKKELISNTSNQPGGPIMNKYPDGTEMSVRDLLGYMISQSDNTACDVLLKEIDGPKTVQNYMLNLGVRGIAVRASEADMASSWELQYANWCKPAEMTSLLDQFYRGKLLSKPSTDLLYKLMTETTTGPNRLKGLLPPGTVVAHKTGSSSTRGAYLSAATNDAGIITLPNGKHLGISVFVCNSTDNEATRDGVIAKIAKAAYDFYK